MCPLWPFHYIILFVLLFWPLLLLLNSVAATPNNPRTIWNVTFSPLSIMGLKMSQTSKMNFTTSDLTDDDISYGVMRIVSSDPDIVDCSSNCFFHKPFLEPQNHTWSSSFSVTGKFLGNARLKMVLETPGIDGESDIRETAPVPVSVIRNERLIDKLFTISVAVLVSVIFINFGCALNWSQLKEDLRNPVGPVIGFISQFLFMPLISYALGKLLFPNSIPLQLGLFFTGVSPGGGASNIWIYTLGGNINLSITMTTISTIASFVMMPLWTFTLGRYIFADGAMTVPYSRIASIAVGLVVPLFIGYSIQRKSPRVSSIMTRILKPFSAFLIVFIIIFASITNFYLFQLFTWRILLAGFGLPWFGYVFGWIFAKVLGQSPNDSLAVAVETGVQNTGISIFMLRFSLGQPEADLTTVVPVAVALMTPIPLTILYIIKKLRKTDKADDRMIDILAANEKLERCAEESFTYIMSKHASVA